MDTTVDIDICSIVTKLDNCPVSQIFLGWDFIALGKPEIMKYYCTGLENNFGNYNYNVNVPENLPIMKDYHYIDKKRWTYATERQLFEMLFEFCNYHGYDINVAIKSIEEKGEIIRKIILPQ